MPRILPKNAVALLSLGALLDLANCASTQDRQDPGVMRNGRGLQLMAVMDASQPTVRIVLPGAGTSDTSIKVLVPEHVTALRHGDTIATHLFLPGPRNVERAAWRSFRSSLEYRKTLPDDVDMVVRATLESDGVRFTYEVTNRSSVTFDMITAVTDPRLTGVFHDVRLERTYVHNAGGLALIAREFPDRLTMPMDRWLPARVLAPFTWPVPAQRVERRGDGITYYNTARSVDVPVILTRSTDGEWVVASVSRAPGNVWSNPQLTCQHVDPQSSLAPGQRITLEVKLLVMRASLEEVLEHAIREHSSMR